MISAALENVYKARVKWTKLRRMLSIPRGQRVIDIGGGDGPFPRADVICEKFLGDSVERTNPLGNAGTRALVVGDIENLPFADKSFDFVFCSHILEHTTDPSRAIAEITRIGKRGYIEVPSEYLEHAATSRTSHYWTILRDPDGTLVFRQKPVATPSKTVSDVFEHRLWLKDKLYMAWHWREFYSLFNIAVTWEGTIPHRVERVPVSPNGGFEKGAVDSIDSIRRALQAASGSRKTGIRPAVKGAITRRLTDPQIRTKILEFAACPACKRKLALAGAERLACAHCHLVYPFINGVPVLLAEHASPAGF
jgi:uncharacterized protein YbaR (Trm112 family)/SAM-dependent methyltransferase